LILQQLVRYFRDTIQLASARGGPGMFYVETLAKLGKSRAKICAAVIGLHHGHYRDYRQRSPKSLRDRFGF
jgi:hypothetical protein